MKKSWIGIILTITIIALFIFSLTRISDALHIDFDRIVAILGLVGTIYFGITANKLANSSNQLSKASNQLGKEANKLAEVGQQFTQKFSPIDIRNIRESSEQIIGGFTTTGIPVKIVTDQISGDIKNMFVGYLMTSNRNNIFYMETLIDLGKQCKTIVINLTGVPKGIEVLDKNRMLNEEARILVFLGAEPFTNVFCLIVEDYQGNREFIMYVLFIDKNTLYYVPLREHDLKSYIQIEKLYKRVSFDKDTLWKKHKINSFILFRMYLEKSLNNFKKKFYE
ncbi:hypothetical protein [Gemella sanguinis]|uniref:hypothetical protein n=1 Tax=Gemella sanguinis TaxID=84135 RepID=UPI0026F16729|nr:hypothetical protein [Gemella sanguinis]